MVVVHNQKATDSEILAAYEATRSCKAAADVLGMCAQSVHERLVKLRANRRINVFTTNENDRLKKEYEAYAFAGKLDILAGDMGRTKQLICRQAGKLGLTNKNRARPYLATWKYISEDVALGIWEKFKDQSLGLGEFCKKHGFDDLGFSRKMQELFADEYDSVIELKRSKQSWYRLGRQFEYKTRDDLRKMGYFVLRSPASRSPMDLIAISHGVVLFIQCKRNMVCPTKDWNSLLNLSESVGAIPIVAGQPERRGILYFRIDGLKDGSKKRQPWGECDPVELRSEKTAMEKP